MYMYNCTLAGLILAIYFEMYLLCCTVSLLHIHLSEQGSVPRCLDMRGCSVVCDVVISILLHKSAEETAHPSPLSRLKRHGSSYRESPGSTPPTKPAAKVKDQEEQEESDG